MDQEIEVTEQNQEIKTPDVTYNREKDFYEGLSGELRFKAEGLFKKAREKGISLEDIDIEMLEKKEVEFPGIGVVELPAFIVKIRGKHLQSGQMMVDGKQMDYYNRYQKYVADMIEEKNLIRDERGKPVKERGKVKVRDDLDFVLDDWEKFRIGKAIIEDKEFGLEKTITGACDRVIRKLMGENDWLYPEEAKMLEEEFNTVQSIIANEREKRAGTRQTMARKATERQINYLKAKIRNAGIDPDHEAVMREVLRQMGINVSDVSELTTSEASKVIDGIGSVLPKVKEILARQGSMFFLDPKELKEKENSIKQ